MEKEAVFNESKTGRRKKAVSPQFYIPVDPPTLRDTFRTDPSFPTLSRVYRKKSITFFAFAIPHLGGT